MKKTNAQLASELATVSEALESSRKDRDIYLGMVNDLEKQVEAAEAATIREYNLRVTAEQQLGMTISSLANLSSVALALSSGVR